MKRTRKLAAWSTVALVAALLGCQSGAVASTGPLPSPRLVVTSDAGTLTTEYSQRPSDSPLARLAVLVPGSYLLVGGVLAGDQAGQIQVVTHAATPTSTVQTTATSTLTATTLTTPIAGGTATTTPAKLFAACAPEPASAVVQVWLATLGQTTTPIFLVQVPDTSPYGFAAFYEIEACFAPAPAVVTDVTLSFTKGVWSVPVGSYRWRALAFPAVGLDGAAVGAEPEAAVQTQSVDGVSQQLVVKGTKSGWLRGRLLSGGRGVTGVRISLREGRKLVASPVTTRTGRFSYRFKLSGRVTATVAAPERPAGPCVAAGEIAATCSGVTLGSLDVVSKSVMVTGSNIKKP